MNNLSISCGIPISDIPDFSSYFGRRVQNSIYMENCSHTEIENIILEFSNGKSSDIPIFILKKVSTLVSPILAYFINQHVHHETVRFASYVIYSSRGDHKLFHVCQN